MASLLTLLSMPDNPARLPNDFSERSSSSPAFIEALRVEIENLLTPESHAQFSSTLREAVSLIDSFLALSPDSEGHISSESIEKLMDELRRLNDSCRAALEIDLRQSDDIPRPIARRRSSSSQQAQASRNASGVRELEALIEGIEVTTNAVKDRVKNTQKEGAAEGIRDMAIQVLQATRTGVTAQYSQVPTAILLSRKKNGEPKGKTYFELLQEDLKLVRPYCEFLLPFFQGEGT